MAINKKTIISFSLIGTIFLLLLIPFAHPFGSLHEDKMVSNSMARAEKLAVEKPVVIEKNNIAANASEDVYAAAAASNKASENATTAAAKAPTGSPEPDFMMLLKILFIAIIFFVASSILGITELWTIKRLGFDVSAGATGEILGIKITTAGAIAVIFFQPLLLLFIALQMLKLVTQTL